MQPLAYRIDQAAAIIGIGRTKLYSLISKGKLRAHRHDGVTLIHRADLESYLAAGDPLPTKAAQ
ncbi:helix-turn-helix domain-containing protein [Methylobacterium sp. C25]|uniref:helix-turn-helix domain-containing protein n=1 Tax=Methylobacterium sp. C25 TaxID=2721622 RepID=UPI001F27590A|nr:helix-turn-helix domain-containing protein [Methylobacterium sp. C25]MCE4223454.1 helix-turn-helix domain-containing protein [Methylobacterium sp. C25]